MTTRDVASTELATRSLGVRRRLRTVTGITVVVVLLIAIHEGFVLASMPVTGPHTWAHVGLILVAFALGYGLHGLWRAYDGLRNAEHGLRIAYRGLDQAVRARTQALAESESLLGLLFDAFRERIFVVDRELRIVKANAAATEWSGRDPRGLPFSEVVTPGPGVQERRSELGLVR